MDKAVKIEWVENILYKECSCTAEEAEEVMMECLRNARAKRYGLRDPRDRKPYTKYKYPDDQDSKNNGSV
jgi:hypothetical protein